MCCCWLFPLFCKSFLFWCSPNVYFCFCFLYLRWLIYKDVARANVKEITACVTFQDLYSFRSHIWVFRHFEFIFVYVVKRSSCSILLHVAVKFSQYYLLTRLSCLHCTFLLSLSYIGWPYKLGFCFWGFYCVPLNFVSISLYYHNLDYFSFVVYLGI